MNRIPILSLAVAAVTLAGCGHSSELAISVKPVQRITPNAPQPAYYSGLTNPLRLVISDDATYEKVWNQAFGDMSPVVPRVVPVPPRPVVDFTHEAVVVAALGGRGSGGYTIEITGAVSTGRELVIDVLATSPGKGCAVTLGLTQPADFVKIPRVPPPVRFEDRSAVTDCSAP